MGKINIYIFGIGVDIVFYRCYNGYIQQANGGLEMQLLKNQYVLFDNGRKEGYLESRYSEKYQAFYTFTDDGEKIFSTTVIDKPERKKSTCKFIPTAESCPTKIYPCATNEKCYILEDGTYGKSKRGFPSKVAYKYIAKSICYVNDNGEIFKPIWA